MTGPPSSRGDWYESVYEQREAAGENVHGEADFVMSWQPASLLDAGVPRCAQKVGEEAVETGLAAVSGDREALVSEAADLVFHLYVLLAATEVDLSEVEDELAARAK